jgi:YhcH/YjgK/YiaL family protein
MIIDNISNYKRYLDLHPAFAKAFEFLDNLKEDDRGSFQINGKALFASIAKVTGRGKDAAKLEAHTKYIDIQYILDGADHIGWADTRPDNPSTEYDQENDYRFVNIKPVSWIDVPKGYFVIFFPEDAHAPLAGQKNMTKVFMKVKANY